ncbi:MAG: metal ABC transporter permease [Piscirickettsiaceae bacterium]|nr:metal ABC transporter permease [Piscirickettsiaceae bacterium]
MSWADVDLILLAPAFFAGVLVLSTHIPLGQEVLKRGIIFIDLAIAQIAALGVIAAIVLGGDLAGWQVQFFAGLSAIMGASLIHWLEQRYADSLEALIGLLFVLAASAALLLISHAPHSDELLHDLLVGQILWVSNQQLLWVLALYIPLLITWFTFDCRQRPIVFYLIFSLAVTASVQLVGIYLVFASLILPALASRSIVKSSHRLLISYALGLSGYLIGLLASLFFDLPMGAITVWTLLAVMLISKPLLYRASKKTLVQ